MIAPCSATACSACSSSSAASACSGCSGCATATQLPLLVVGAALLSAVISYFALRRFREDYSAQLAHKDRAAFGGQAGGGPGATSQDELAEDAEVSGDEGTFR